MATQIATVGTIPTITVGGRVFTDLTNIKYLIGYSDGGNRFTFREHNGTSGYTPSGALAFKAQAAQILGQNTAAQATTGKMGYANNDVGMNSGTALTSPVYIGGSSTISLGSAGAGVINAFPLNFTVPNTRFMFCESAAAVNTLAHVYGYEV